MRKSRSQKPTDEGITRTLGVVSGLLIVTVVLGTVLPLTIGHSANNNIPLPTRLSFDVLPGVDTDFQENVCTCENTWDFCSDERNVSNALFAQSASVPDPRGLSVMAAFWGQLIDHETVLSSFNASSEKCSLQMLPNTEILLNMTRADVRLLGNGCRELLNHQTPTIDASAIYGVSEQELNVLRIPGSCLLNTSAGNLMPLSDTHPREFVAGDERATENAPLASLHTLWVREHNRLCAVLETERPTWTEEERFWKARQVVAAKLQFITYHEWLPALLGSQTSLLQTVPLRGSGVRMTTELSVTAFRFGHSIIADPIGDFPLFTLFFNRTLLIEKGIDVFLEATYTTAAQRMDNLVVDGLRNFLFMLPGMPMGEDLVTRNLFRSRELQMPTYAQMAQCYGFATQNAQEEAYIGLFHEPLVAGSSLPRGIATILTEFFRRLAQNDPLHYTKQHEALGSRFVIEVYRTTLASVIRANTNLQNVPDAVFFV